ncbi:MAG: PepSY-associated TM helix domain-containing protein, partial [Pseudomonadota bacterium]
RILVGLVGIAFLLLILTGIVAHTKFTKELFTLRYLKSVRLKWQDSHKVMGLWTSPFAAMIALTGAFLGVIALLLPLLAHFPPQPPQPRPGIVKPSRMGHSRASSGALGAMLLIPISNWGSREQA